MRDFASPVDQVVDVARHLVLPVTTVALGLIGQYSLLMRSAVTEVLAEDYVQTARAKGLKGGRDPAARTCCPTPCSRR